MQEKLNIDEIPSFREIANNRSKLPYDPKKISEDGSVLIGTLMSDDFSYTRWSIVPKGSGYAILIESLTDGIDDDGEVIICEKPSKAYFLPVKDITEEKKRRIELGIKEYADLPDYIPDIYDSVESAYTSFLDVVYSSEYMEKLYSIEQDAQAIINGYTDPKTDDFPKFREAFWNACAWDNYDKKLSPTKLANAMLCIRYPFLIPWGPQDSEPWDGSEKFNYTSFTSIPTGWAKRFGLEMCEDLRNQAYDELKRAWTWKLCEMRPSQIKEKFGGLRWYGSAYGRGQDLIDIYENISYEVCIDCGSADSTRITSGWISPVCLKDIISKDKRDVWNKAREKYLKNQEDASFEEKAAAARIASYISAITTTRPAGKSEDLSKLLEKWMVRTYSKDEGEQEINRSIGLLDGTPAPNGQPVWASQVILDVAADIAKLETDPIGSEIREALEKLDLDESLIPEWWSDEEEEAY